MQRNENINKLKKEIKQKYPTVYEIDLKNDMDYAKSPQNEIKQTDEYWEFVCEKGAEDSFGDFEVIRGRLEKREEYFQGIFQKQSFGENENEPSLEKIFSAILPLHDKYDILNISFKVKAKQFLKMFVYNDCLYHQNKKNIKVGDLENNEDNLVDQDAVKSQLPQFTAFNLEQRGNLSVAVESREAALHEYIAFEDDCQGAISFYLDYKMKKININSQKWRRFDAIGVDFDKSKHFEVQSGFQNGADSFDNDNFCIYKIMYAQNKGYIYLKPVTLPKGNYQLFLYYTGGVILEYARENSNNWETCPDKFRILEKETLQLRIKVNSGDKLYDLFIVNK